MAYVTNAEIVTRLGNDTAVQLTTEAGSVVDTALIDKIIAEVEGDIDQVVRKRTSEAITQATYPQTFAMLRGRAVDMTIFRLALRRPPVADAWKDANEKAVAELDKLAKGEIDLPDDALNDPRLSYGSADQNAAKSRGL